MTLDVVGLRFRWKRDSRRMLADMIAKRGSITGIRLVREPDNRFDPNAIMVLLPERIASGYQLGYLRASSAEVLAPALDSGRTMVVSAKLEGLNEDDDYNTGEVFVRFKDRPKSLTKRKKPAKKPQSAKP